MCSSDLSPRAISHRNSATTPTASNTETKLMRQIMKPDRMGSAAARGAVNALVMGEIFYLFNCRYLLAPVRNWQDFSGNRYVLLSIAVLVVIQLVFTYVPFMQKMFGVVALDAAAWALIVGFGVLLFIAVEIEKLALRGIRQREE